MAVAVEVFGVIHAAMDFGEFCARRTGVVVALGVVDEVLPGEEAAFGPARRQGLGHDRRDARTFARQNLVAAEVAAVGQDRDLLVLIAPSPPVLASPERPLLRPGFLSLATLPVPVRVRNCYRVR